MHTLLSLMKNSTENYEAIGDYGEQNAANQTQELRNMDYILG